MNEYSKLKVELVKVLSALGRAIRDDDIVAYHAMKKRSDEIGRQLAELGTVIS